MVDPKIASEIPVVILCGGQGTRMRGGTLTKKELVEIGGRPILWHVMRIYSAHGFNRFVLPLGYAGDQIKRYFLDYEAITRDFQLQIGGDGQRRVMPHGSAEHPAWTIDLIDTGLETNRAARVRCVADHLTTDRFMVTYGDGVGSVNIEALLDFHLAHGKTATVTAIQPGHYQYGTMNAGEDGVVTSYDDYPPLPYWIDAGFMVFERRFLDMMEDDPDLDLAGHMLPRLANQQDLVMYRHRGFWQSMDTLKDAMVLEERWQQDAPWKVWA